MLFEKKFKRVLIRNLKIKKKPILNLSKPGTICFWDRKNCGRKREVSFFDVVETAGLLGRIVD